MKKLLIASLIVLILFSSCVKEEEGELGPTGENWKEKPDMSLMGTSLTMYDGENDPIEVTAEKADFWTDESRAEMTGFSFIQKDTDGNVSMHGSASKALVDTETSEFELVGSIVLESVRDGLRITTEEKVFFNADTEEIDAPGRVTVTGEGSFFSGEGFYGNLRKEEYSFERILEGRFDV